MNETDKPTRSHVEVDAVAAAVPNLLRACNAVTARDSFFRHLASLPCYCSETSDLSQCGRCAAEEVLKLCEAAIVEVRSTNKGE